MPRGGMVTLTRKDLGAGAAGSQLTLILTSAPDRSGGVGGWVASDRALRRPAKWWKSTPDDTMTLNCLVDIDAIGGPAIERRIRVLRDMGQPQGKDREPPAIRVTGDVWNEDQSVDWVMNALSLGDRLFNSDGTLRRQTVTIGLERYESVSEIKALNIRATRTGKKNNRRTRTVTTRGFDTLRAVALRELGDATRWKDLQRWNAKKLKGVDPDAVLRTGTHITLR